ncbi:NAD(P)/FAD-dependent oxidoreductase [Actinokineospora iranica]|uniref:Dehydrogenase (Flavoprotein) n=1 Tax=Actinokineospora iranica TaxID=1271860 RepID=A0A1G6S1A8_9PSEU|nr:FAD-binding protein [Actinokineospora iranica]SDD10618.1 Dehydrogenase (flavoprotein) [Actinokineospora iranica]
MASGTHAVVLGASIAGLLAARVLHEHYDRVTVVERDRLPEAGQRRGVPQGRHLHGLMERGRSIMESLYPGLTDEVSRLGAPTTEVLVRSRWYLSGLRAHPTPTGLTTLLASRPLLETEIRRRTSALGVRLRERTAAVGLLTSAGKVTGVEVTDNEMADGRTEAIAADLVVDATGRASRAPDWLAAMGAAVPGEDRVDVDLGYASRTYRRRPEHLDGDYGVVISTMPGRRGGGAIRLEGDRWHVTLGGMLGDHPPTDHDGFTAFAATLPVPDIHRIVSVAEPLDDAVPHRFRGSLRRYYERLASPPAGFLVVGDALCSFNPLYAQGMTVAAQQALALRECLPDTGGDLPARFYAKAARLVDIAWQMSTNSDLNHPGVVGDRTLRTRLVNSYVTRAHRAAHIDPAVSRTFMRLANLVESPTALMRPAMIARVLWQSTRNVHHELVPVPARRPGE